MAATHKLPLDGSDLRSGGKKTLSVQSNQSQKKKKKTNKLESHWSPKQNSNKVGKLNKMKGKENRSIVYKRVYVCVSVCVCVSVFLSFLIG